MKHAKKKSSDTKGMGSTKIKYLNNDASSEFFAMIISLIVTIGAVALIGMIPVSTSTDKYIGVLLPNRLSHCFPEPLEMLQYAVTAVLIPVIFLVSYCLLKRVIRKQSAVLMNICYFGFIALIGVVSILAFYVTRKGNYYIKTLFSLSFFLLIPV
ncbi:MAG: hypothetical protein IJ725_04660, partial [Ruminococcus sp.]|nr:hypothetical protein [Ruminococcus sp.]